MGAKDGPQASLWTRITRAAMKPCRAGSALSGFLIQNMQGQAKNQNLKKKNFFLKVFRCFLYAARFGDHSHKSNWVLKLHLSIKMQIPRCPALGGALTSEFSQVPQVILIQLGLQLSSSL